jgi:hypothetical protein
MNHISVRMRDVLIDHLDGKKVRIKNEHAASLRGIEATEWERRQRSTDSLERRGFVEKVDRDRYTQITGNGREALAELLADYAEVLVAIALSKEECAVPRTPAIWLHLIERRTSASLMPGPDTAMSTVAA